MVFKFFRRMLPKRSVSLSQRTMATLWRLQGVLNKPTASDLIESLTANAARQYGIDDFTSNVNVDKDTKANAASSNSSTVKPAKETNPKFGEIYKGEIKYDDPSEVNFLTFKNSYLENVPPSEAYVDGKWFDIKHWNEVVFEVIRILVEKRGVGVQEIATLLPENIKIGYEDGLKPIIGLNLSYINIRSPQVSWKCIETLHLKWGIDVRVRFKWNEKAKVELRGLSYEIRTLPKELNDDE